MYPVAILAGGLGTRIASISPDLPKAMIEVAGHPFIDYKLTGLSRQGVQRVVLFLGHGAETVRDHVGDGRGFGLAVDYMLDGPRLLGTGGAIRRGVHLLGEAFWVTYGDTYLRFPIRPAEESFNPGSADCLMTVLRNEDRWDVSNVEVEEGKVTRYAKGAPGAFRYIDYGMLLLKSSSFDVIEGREPAGLGDVIEPIVAARRVSAFEVYERFYEIGTPGGLEETKAFFEREKIILGLD